MNKFLIRKLGLICHGMESPISQDGTSDENKRHTDFTYYSHQAGRKILQGSGASALPDWTEIQINGCLFQGRNN